MDGMAQPLGNTKLDSGPLLAMKHIQESMGKPYSCVINTLCFITLKRGDFNSGQEQSDMQVKPMNQSFRVIDIW